MSVLNTHRFESVASARDLVAKIVETARVAKRSGSAQRMLLLDPKLTAERAKAVFVETIALFPQELADKLSLEVQIAQRPSPDLNSDVLTLPARPTTRHDLLRHLIDARISQQPPVPGQALSLAMGLSEHPIREASKALEAAGLLRTTHEGRALCIEPWECTSDLQSRVEALPVRVRYRYRAGATPLSADDLSRRFEAVCDEAFVLPWFHSGVHAARRVCGQIDLSGAPRVDLIVRVPPKERAEDISWLGEITPRMEREPNPLESAPLVVTIVQEANGPRSEDTDHRIASYADILICLLDQGLDHQAREFVAGVRAAA